MSSLIFYAFIFLFMSHVLAPAAGGSKEDSMEECDEYFQNLEHALLGMMESDKMPDCFREVMTVFESGSDEGNSTEDDVLETWVKLWNHKEGDVEIKDKKKFESCMEDVWKEIHANVQEPSEECKKEMKKEDSD